MDILREPVKNTNKKKNTETKVQKRAPRKPKFARRFTRKEVREICEYWGEDAEFFIGHCREVIID